MKPWSSAALRITARRSRPACAPGDKILTVNDEEIPDLAGLWRRVWSSGSAGAEVRLRIERDGSPKRVSVRSADRVSFLKSPRLH